MKKLIKSIDSRDVIGVSGLSMLFYGTYIVSPAAAFVVVGGIMTMMAARGL